MISIFKTNAQERQHLYFHPLIKIVRSYRKQLKLNELSGSLSSFELPPKDFMLLQSKSSSCFLNVLGPLSLTSGDLCGWTSCLFSGRVVRPQISDSSRVFTQDSSGLRPSLCWYPAADLSLSLWLEVIFSRRLLLPGLAPCFRQDGDEKSTKWRIMKQQGRDFSFLNSPLSSEALFSYITEAQTGPLGFHLINFLPQSLFVFSHRLLFPFDALSHFFRSRNVLLYLLFGPKARK